jgi:F0F1-type ATP synthase membrane subunit c/vacuolar-type H+-ATPase subunit K
MRQQKIIWFAIAFSTVIYLFMAYWIAPVPPRSFEESLRTTTTLAMYGVALAVFNAGLVMPSLTLAQSPPQSKMTVTLAIFEACAIFGLVAAFLQQDWRLYVPTWFVSLIGMVRAFPKDEQITA